MIHDKSYDPDQPRIPAGNPDGGQWAGSYIPSLNPSLNEEQKKAIYKYTGDSFSDINMHLRFGNNIIPENKALINEIDNILDNTVLENDITVFRGGEFYSLSGEDILDLRESYFVKGGVFEDKSFISTTFDREKAVGFSGIVSPVVFEIKVPKNNNGLYLESVSSRPYEKEFLMPRSTKFKIVDIDRDGVEITDTWHIKLDVYYE